MSTDPNQANQYGGYTPPTGDQSGQQGAYQGYQGYYQQQQQQQQQQQYTYGQQQQQQYTYQPPTGASKAGSGAFDPTSTGMDAKNEALFSYLFWWLSGLVFFVIERKNEFVRFAAAQSFIFLGGAFVLYVIVRLITIIPVVGFLLNPVLSCASFVILIPTVLIWLFLMFQAHRGVKVKLPIVGGYAEALVTRFSRKKKTA